MQTPTCPHCGKAIELYEPSDLDALGLDQNRRKAATDKGGLRVWARLRSGKLFLYLKSDVAEYVDNQKVRDRREMAKKAGIREGILTDDDINKFFDDLETRAKRREKEAGKNPGGANENESMPHQAVVPADIE